MRIFIGIIFLVTGILVAIGSIKSGNSNMMLTGIGLVAAILGLALTLFKKDID